MASMKLTDYERQRLDNIRRNEEMMASFKIQSIASELSASTKRLSSEAKSKRVRPRTETTPIVIRRSLRARGMPPDSKGLDDGVVFESQVKNPKYPDSSPRKLGPLNMSDVYMGEGSDRSLIEMIVGIGKEFEGVRVSKDESLSKSVMEEGSVEGFGKEESCEAENSGFLGKKEGDSVGGSLDVYSMTLNPDNIARIMSDRIRALRFFPCASSRMIVAGNKFGDIAFWNLDHDRSKEDDGVYVYHPHPAPVSGISIHPHCLSKVYSSCHDGFVRVMDAEKEVFDLIHSSDYSVCSLAQRSSDVKCLYFGDANGGFKILDERSGKCSTQRVIHTHRINSIDFNSQNPNLMATSCSDRTACIWDLRSINANKPKTLKTVNHERSVQAAYFSPSGKCLATTSFDDTVGILGGVNFEESSRIEHNNQTGRWIVPFKAIWGWDDSYIFIGNMKRGVDILSPAHRQKIYTLQSSNISAISCRFDVHPYNVGMLAGSTSGGQVYIWTMS